MVATDTLLQNRYLVIRQLQRGGMGAVYLANDQHLGKTFALKESFFSDNDQLRLYFEREAQLLANLDQPVLPRVTDHFTEGEGQYLVMEYIPGEDLAKQLIINGKPFPPGKVLEWADQLLDCLQYLHSDDPPIIHRNIKPANLKLTAKGKIILLDFGLAKGAAGDMTHVVDSVRGYRQGYAPLEQIESKGTDELSDLYSLGATLYHLMTGQTPPMATTRKGRRKDPLRPANEVNPEVSVAVATILQQAMALYWNGRPIDAPVMREALRPARQAISSETTASAIAREEKPSGLLLLETLTNSNAESPPANMPSPTLKISASRQQASDPQSTTMPVRNLNPASPSNPTKEEANTSVQDNEIIKLIYQLNLKRGEPKALM